MTVSRVPGTPGLVRRRRVEVVMPSTRGAFVQIAPESRITDLPSIVVGRSAGYMGVACSPVDRIDKPGAAPSGEPASAR